MSCEAGDRPREREASGAGGRALISKVYNFGLERDDVEVNPAKGIRRQPEKARQRVLDSAWCYRCSVTSASPASGSGCCCC